MGNYVCGKSAGTPTQSTVNVTFMIWGLLPGVVVVVVIRHFIESDGWGQNEN